MLASSSLQQHIHDVLQPAYARRFHAMMQAIEEEILPLGVTMPQVNRDVGGGYFVWLTLPKNLNAQEVAKQTLHEEGLVVGPGPLFEAQGDKASKGKFDSDIRLSFAWADEDLLAEGIDRLASVIKRALNEKKP